MVPIKKIIHKTNDLITTSDTLHFNYIRFEYFLNFKLNKNVISNDSFLSMFKISVLNVVKDMF